MALRFFLGNQYPVSEIMPAGDWLELLADDSVNFGRYRLFQGHFGFGFFDLLPPGTRSVVFLREPVARTISHLKHLRRDPDFHPAHRLAVGRSLDELVRDDRVMQLCCNIQVAQLCNDISGEAILSGLRAEAAEGGRPNLDDYVLKPDLAKAERNLGQFHFVGFVETLHDDILQMALAFGLHPPSIVPKRNDDPEAAIGSVELEPETLAILRERNALDIAFYEAARRRPRLSAAVVGATLIERGRYEPILQPVDFPMWGPIPGSNWYEPEDPDGEWARWTGPLAETTLDLPLVAGNRYGLSLSLLIADLDQLRVYAGGMLLPLQRVRSDGKVHRVSFWVPSEAVQADGLTTVTFRTQRVFRAAAPDLRLLSFKARDLSISRVEPAAGHLGDLASAAAELGGSDALPAAPPVALPLDPASPVRVVREPTGFFPDGWVRAQAAVRFRALRSISSMSLEVWAPPGDQPLELTVGVAGVCAATAIIEREKVSDVQVKLGSGTPDEFTVELSGDDERRLSDADARYASYVLRSVLFA